MQTFMAIIARIFVYRNSIPVSDSYINRRACLDADSSMMTNALLVLNYNCASIQRNEQQDCCHQCAPLRKHGSSIPHLLLM